MHIDQTRSNRKGHADIAAIASGALFGLLAFCAASLRESRDRDHLASLDARSRDDLGRHRVTAELSRWKRRSFFRRGRFGGSRETD
jgi:hypothetical protein